jgi:tetratricopeptide (TPR) repeat protein
MITVGSVLRTPAAVSLALCALFTLSGCGESTSRERSAFGVPIVLISIDTLRSDHLPAYGYEDVDTPAIDRLRADGILFERAYSPVPLTLPAHASMLTGLLPPHHGVRDNIGYSLSGESPTLAGVLGGHGYRTGAAVSGIVLRRETGIASGFEHFDDRFDAGELAVLGEIQRAGTETVETIIPWLETVAEEPLFLFVHLYDPHTPYDPPEPYASRYASPYDGEIAFADEAVGRLLKELDRLGLYERSMIILTSDHGEGLFDHGEGEHGIFLYRESLQVPLLVKLPSGELAGNVVPDPVQLSDIPPTVLSWIGVTTPEAMTGVPLLELVGSSSVERVIYGESFYPELRLGWSALRSLISNNYHYIEAPSPELFDLVADPWEHDNLLLRQRRVYAAMRVEMEAFDLPVRQPHEADSDVQEALLSLGYLGGRVADGDGERRPDPKERIHTLQVLDDGLSSYRRGDRPTAIAKLEQSVLENPELVVAWQFLGLALSEEGRAEEAYHALSEAFRVSHGAATLARSLALVALETGRIEQADEYLRLAIREDPDDLRLEMLRGRTLIELGRLDEALRVAERLGREHSDNADVAYLAGTVKMGLGRLDEAETDLRAALALASDHTAAMSDLAVLMVSVGRREEASLLVDRLLQIRPEDPVARELGRELDQRR